MNDQVNNNSSNITSNTTSHREDDEESALTTIDNNEPIGQINIDEYCISSDADTEKMESDILHEEEELHPKLSDLLSSTKRKLDEDLKDLKEGDLKEEDLKEEDLKEEDLKEEDLKEGEQQTHKKIKIESKDEETTTSPPENVEVKEAIEPTAIESTVNEPAIVKPATVEESTDIKPTTVEPIEGSSSKPMEENKLEEEDDDINEGDKEEDDEDINEDVDEDSHSDHQMPSAMELENKRLEAMDDIISIEYKFATLRQKLYENKLAKLELELQMCLEGSHPELHGYYEKISNIRDYKLKRAYQRQKYELLCIDKETRATRTMIHQDYFKKISDLKRRLLTSTTREWYDINKERREMDTMIPDISYHVPVKIANKTLSCITGYAGPAQQRLIGEPISEDMECENIEFKYRNNPVDKLEVIVDRMRLNNQLSDLEGLKRFYQGFPGAPGLNGLRDSEINEDFEMMQMMLMSGEPSVTH